MARHTGVTSARAVCKPCSSPSLSRSSSSNKLVRRRGRGSLVRSRAFIWSKEDLEKLHQLANKPRHQVTPDIVDSYALPKSPILSPSEYSSSTDADDSHHVFHGAVDQHPSPLQMSLSRNDHSHSVNHIHTPSTYTAATTSKPPLQRTRQISHSSTSPSHFQLPPPSHHSPMPQPSATNQCNLAVVSGIAASLIDLTL